MVILVNFVFCLCKASVFMLSTEDIAVLHPFQTKHDFIVAIERVQVTNFKCNRKVTSLNFRDKVSFQRCMSLAVVCDVIVWYT